jgi:hypothetical protein
MTDPRAEFWQHGLTLESAAYHCATKDMQQRWRAFCDTKIAITPAPPDLPAGMAEAILLVAESIKPIIEHQTASWKIREEMQQRLQSLLSGGHLRAMGFPLPRSVNDAPNIVPVDLWSGKIDWKMSAIAANGLEFVAVRVLTAATEDRALAVVQPALLPAPRPGRGRPALAKPRVAEAYAALKGSGEIDYDLPMAAFYPKIRRYLTIQYPTDAARLGALSDEMLRQVAGPMFKNDVAIR